MLKCTPWPWEASDTRGNIYGATGDVVASIHGLPKSHLTGERNANGQLITAAPELAEALEAACNDIALATEVAYSHGDHGLRTELESRLKSYRAALAKAGVTP